MSRYRYPNLAAPLVLGLVALAAGCGPDPPGRSVILITVDTLRADHLPAWGYPRETAPHLDRFLERGARVEWAFSAAPSTAPSHASIMTGRYPSFHTVGIRNGDHVLSDEETTLAEICSDAGLATAAVVSNPVLQRFLGLDQGFDIYDDDLTGSERHRDLPDQRADVAVDKALGVLDSLGDRPSFFWLHLQDPHGPYDPPGFEERRFEAEGVAAVDLDRKLETGTDDVGFERIPAYQAFQGVRSVREYVDRYDAEIRFLDGELRRLTDRLDADGRLEDTMVVITSDHGEAMGEEGFFFAHSHSVSLDQTRVPLAFVGGGVEAGRVIRGPVPGIDLFATILDYLDLPVPEGSPSRSVLPALRAEDASPGASRTAFTEAVTQRGIARGGRYLRRNLVDFTRQPPPSAKGKTDWRQVRLSESLVGFDGEPVEAAKRELLGALQGFHVRAEQSRARLDAVRRSAELSQEERERLRRLGYGR